MSVADKLLQLNQVKQDIKQAIEDKGVAMSGVPFTNYPLKISEISGGSPLEFTDDLEQAQKAKEVFAMSDKVNNLNNVWEDYKRTPELKYDLNLMLASSDLEMGGFNIDIYIGDSVLTQLYNDCVNGVINYGDLHVLDHNHVDIPVLVARTYFGDVSDFVGMPFPMYGFGLYGGTASSGLSFATAFAVGDLTPLGMGVGISLVKLTTGFTFDNIKVYEKYNNYREGLIADLNEVGWFFDVVYDLPLVIPDSVTSIGLGAFLGWEVNNHPLVIPNSVEVIIDRAFENWNANDQPLVIPNSVTYIGNGAFYGWNSTPHAEIHATTPPTSEPNNFNGSYPIYVPDASLNAYKTATNWVSLADRIFPISDKG